jgi:hypothetical protein
VKPIPTLEVTNASKKWNLATITATGTATGGTYILEY